MEQIASLHWWMIKDKFFFKSYNMMIQIYIQNNQRAYIKKIQTTFIFGNLSECDKCEHFVYKHICEGSILRAGLISIYDIYKFYDIC